MTVAVGAGGTLLIGEGATWGTPATRDRACRMVSMGLLRQRSKKAIEDLGWYGAGSDNPRDFLVEADNAGGPLSCHLAYDDDTLVLLKHLFGGVTEGGGGGPSYTHLFEPGWLDGLDELTLEQLSGKPGSGNANLAEVFSGCRLAGGTISVDTGGIMMLETEIIARTSGGLVAVTSPSPVASSEKIKFNHAGALTINGVARPIRSMKLTIERGLDRNAEMSLFTSEPIQNGLQVFLEVSALWQQATWDTELLNDNRADGTLTFTGTSPNVAALAFDNALVLSVDRQVRGRGAIEQTVRMQLYGDSSGDEGCRLTITNDTATI